MTTAEALLRELCDRGISVRVAGGRLHLGPRARLTPDLLDRLRPYGRPIIQALRADRLWTLPDDLLDAWAERVAICTVEGRLSEEEAEDVAWGYIECCSSPGKL